MVVLIKKMENWRTISWSLVVLTLWCWNYLDGGICCPPLTLNNESTQRAALHNPIQSSFERFTFSVLQRAYYKQQQLSIKNIASKLTHLYFCLFQITILRATCLSNPCCKVVTELRNHIFILAHRTVLQVNGSCHKFAQVPSP